MTTFYPSITDEQAALIKKAPMFFIATADPALGEGPDGEGPVNVSPKGGVPLHVLTPNRVAFLDYVGSGNETARHSIAGGPITVMVASFEAENAGIIRLYGKAKVTPIEESPLAEMLLESPADEIKLPTRQVIEIEVEKTMTSCGYGVPVMSFTGERTIVNRGRAYKEPRKPAKAQLPSATA